MKFVLHKDKILVDIIESDDFYKSDTKILEQKGKVVDVGKSVKFVKKGDILFFLSWGHNSFKHEGKVYEVVTDHDNFILGKMSDGKRT